MIRKTTIRKCIVAATTAAILTAPGLYAQPESYQAGQRAIREQRWQDAVDLFRDAERADRDYADAALYWQAYAYCQSGRDRQGRRRIETLQRKHPDSDWLDDGHALAVECDSGPIVAAPDDPLGPVDPELRLYIISRLMERDPERALPKVMEMLESTDSDDVRRQALFVLGMSDSEQAHVAIANIARNASEPGLQLEAIHVLGAAGDEDTAALLAEVYESSKNTEVRMAVLQAWMIAENEDLLIKALRNTDSPELQRQVIQYLGVMEASDALRGLYQEFSDRETRIALLQAFAIAEDSEALMDALKNETDPILRQMAIRSIAIAEDDDAAEVLASVYHSSTTREEKLAVLDGLMILESDAELVFEIARNESDRELQGRAIQTLGIMEATEFLRDLYADISDRELRGMVLQSLAIAEDSEGLINALENENDPEIRHAAIQALAMTEDDDAVDYLVGAYPQASQEEKTAIVHAMMILDDAQALVELLGVETDPRLKRGILQTLSLIDSDEAAEYLFEMLDDN